MVPETPLVNPVKLVAVLPVYEIISLPILMKPLSSKSAVESTVRVVAVALIAAPIFVVLEDKPRFTTLSYKLTVAPVARALLSLLSTLLVMPVKVVAVFPV